MDHFIPLSIPNFEGNEKEYVSKAVEQGWVSTGGAYITELEEKMAAYLGVPKVAACQSGTAAIHLSLVECGVGPKDIVIVPTLTFIAAVNPVKYQFAEPVFMDCDDSLCIDPVKLRKFCETECVMQSGQLTLRATGKAVKAVIVVHVFGNMADMEAIMDIAGKFNLKVIEDATEALGTYYTEGRYKGKFAGTIGDFGAYSFNGNKIITTGGGGAVTGRHEEHVNHLQYLSTQAKDDPHYYIHDEIGYNYRMTNFQAALGVAQMEELEEFISRKNKNYNLYKTLLKDFEYGTLKEFRHGTRSNRWFYALELKKEMDQEHLRKIILQLQEKGIQTRLIWGLIHEQKPYLHNLAYEIEQAVKYSRCVINLPCSTQITDEDIHYVVSKLRDIFR